MQFMSVQIDTLDRFFQKLPSAPSRVLVLDYDGTLAPFRVERDQAVPYPGVRELLTRIRRIPTCRLVIVSGRGVADLRPLLGLEPPPEIWGCHGWEQLCSDGRLLPPELPPAAVEALGAARAWGGQQGLGQQLEVKPASVAVHWRGLPAGEQGILADRAEQAWRLLAAAAGLQLHPFDGGLELRCPGRDKGFAINRILNEEPADAAVAFLGDDLTDEDAFEALAGRGLGVLVRSEARPTAAAAWIEPPGGLLDFLRRWLAACEKG